MKLLIFICLAVPFTYALTCYNGMKMMAFQSVGESTEECPASSYCYNMSTSAMVMVNFVKAGCSRWRCMLAQDTCIFTTFQAIPVSLCCCSYDRCNVGGNPVYSDNPKQITDSGSWGGNAGMNNNGWGNNNNNNNFDHNQQFNYGGQNAAPEPKMTKQDWRSDNTAPQRGSSGSDFRMTPKEMEEAFKKQIDDRGDEIQLEDEFKKIDKNYKTQSVPSKPKSPGPMQTLTAKKEVEHMPIGKSSSSAQSSTSTASPSGKEIEI